jgi:hypothetical protein
MAAALSKKERDLVAAIEAAFAPRFEALSKRIDDQSTEIKNLASAKPAAEKKGRGRPGGKRKRKTAAEVVADDDLDALDAISVSRPFG